MLEVAADRSFIHVMYVQYSKISMELMCNGQVLLGWCDFGDVAIHCNTFPRFVR